MPHAPWPDNAPGDWHVDRGCIDCGMCRVVDPDTFGEAEDHALVVRQPDTPVQRLRAGMALVACPVAAIHGKGADLRAAAAAFPDPVAPDVYACGFASAATYGASSWLIVRPEGNVMVDVPRAVPALLDRIAALGGVRTLFLTHRDDLDGHEKIAERFGCERVLLRADADARSRSVERLLDGDTDLAPDLRVIATPGHTRGSACLLFRDILFTGDHVWGTGPVGWHAEGVPGGLGAGRSVCWYDWGEQVRSMRRLSALNARNVLPGHGRPWRGDVGAALVPLIAWMETVA